MSSGITLALDGKYHTVDIKMAGEADILIQNGTYRVSVLLFAANFNIHLGARAPR